VKLVDRMEGVADERPVERESRDIHVVLDHVRQARAHRFARHVRFSEEYDPSLPRCSPIGSTDQVFSPGQECR